MDITHPSLLKLKGLLFLVVTAMSGYLIYLEAPNLRTVAFLAVCLWSFARFYYFLFYVLEHYVGSGESYAGIFDLLKKIVTKTPDSGGRE